MPKGHSKTPRERRSDEPAAVERVYAGSPVGAGVAIGTAFRQDSRAAFNVREFAIPPTKVRSEQHRLLEAAAKATARLETLQTEAKQMGNAAGEELGYLIEAYQQMLSGSRLIRGVQRRIAADNINAEAAVLEGERVARSLAAQDVRTLVSRDGGRTLEPYAARFGDRPEKLLAYVAVKYLGYWAESFISTGASRDARERASRALDALIDGLEAHAPVGSLVRRVSELTGPQHPALQGSFGNRIGLSPNEGRALIAGSTETIVPGTTYALRVGSPDGAIASAMVVVKADGKHEILLRSDPKE